MARYCQFEFLMAGMRDASGNALGAGTVGFYMPGTTTLKNVFTAYDGTGGAASNPHTLDARGAALLFGIGAYKIVIKDVDGVTQYTWDNLIFGLTADAQRSTVVATSAGQTTYSLSFTPTKDGSGVLAVFNGVLMDDSDYSISGGSLVLGAGQAALVQVGDSFEVIEL